MARLPRSRKPGPTGPSFLSYLTPAALALNIHAPYRTLKLQRIAVCLSRAMRSVTSTLRWVYAEWHLHYAECSQNDTYLIRWLCAEGYVHYSEYAQYDTCLTLSICTMTPTLRWVCAEWHLPYAEYMQNDTYITLSMHRMTPTLRWWDGWYYASSEWALNGNTFELDMHIK